MIKTFALFPKFTFFRTFAYEIVNSGETDATELMSLRCDGETSCTWDASIADEIVDPCSDVFKYMTVDYECGE